MFLAGNAQKLQDLGVFYCPPFHSVGGANHNLLALAFYTSVQRTYRRLYGEDLALLRHDSLTAWRDLRKDFDRSGCKTLLLSAEFFAGCENKQIANFLRDEFGTFDITIIFYLRRPSEHFSSLAQQSIKGSNALKYLARNRHSGMLAKWAQLGDIVIREFNREALVGRDAVLDFAHVIELNHDGLEMPAPQNETISAEGMELLLMHRRFHFPETRPQIMPESRKLIQKIRKLEHHNGKEIGFTYPRLHKNFAEYLDSDVNEIEALDRQFSFRFAGLEPVRHLPDNPVLERRRFYFVSEQMRYNIDVRHWLRCRLEKKGIVFPTCF